MQRRTKEASPAVDVTGLSKTYAGGVEAVKDVSFTVAPGEVFGLLGPNGA
ncbi:MAG: multidrug ABC transporter ATP-binding protein, partial [Acidimicrobiia bacterium]|nr:multidrug ABC transporter ATP-binding protein [Acidimicrobiia bacterium]